VLVPVCVQVPPFAQGFGVQSACDWTQVGALPLHALPNTDLSRRLAVRRPSPSPEARRRSNRGGQRVGVNAPGVWSSIPGSTTLGSPPP
jgi:hypothetical protein